MPELWREGRGGTGSPADPAGTAGFYTGYDPDTAAELLDPDTADILYTGWSRRTFGRKHHRDHPGRGLLLLYLLYFSGLDADGDFINLTSNLADIKKQPGVLNGTGFFIDETGRILTNRHVVAPAVDKAMVRNNVNAIIENYAQYLQSLQDSMDQRYAALQEYAQENTYEDDYGETYTNLSKYERTV